MWKTSIFQRVVGWRNFSKVSMHFNKILYSLRQVLQIYSEICIFCVLQKSLPEAVGKDWSQSARKILWWNWWWCDEIYIIVNLGQKCGGNLGYQAYHFSYDFWVFFKYYEFTVLEIRNLSYRMLITYCLSFVISHIECIVSSLFKWGWG